MKKMKSIFFLFVVNLFSRLRSEKTTSVFVSLSGGYYDNLKYFSEFLSKRGEKDIVWLYGGIESTNFPKVLKVVSLESFKAMMILSRAKVVYFNGWSRFFSQVNFHKSLVVQMWHGTPLRCVGMKDKYIGPITKSIMKKAFIRYNVITTTSQKINKRFIDSFSLEDKHRLYPIGFPRNDMLMKKKEKKNVKNSVLYVPTWRPYENAKAFSHSQLKMLDRVFRLNNLKLDIKHHANTLKGDLVDELENIRYLDDLYDIQELMANSCAIITDYSSVAIDYALLERPIIFYCYDYERYKESVGLYEEIESIYTGPIAYNFEQLIGAIENIADFNVDHIVNFKKKFHDHTDGKSCERLYNLVKEKLNEI